MAVWAGYYRTRKHNKLVPIAFVEAESSDEAKERVARYLSGISVRWRYYKQWYSGGRAVVEANSPEYLRTMTKRSRPEKNKLHPTDLAQRNETSRDARLTQRASLTLRGGTPTVPPDFLKKHVPPSSIFGGSKADPHKKRFNCKRFCGKLNTELISPDNYYADQRYSKKQKDG